MGDALTGHLQLLDQTKLPGTIHVLDCRTPASVVKAIRRLSVRGAPALGVAGAYGTVLCAQRRLRDGDLLKAERRFGDESVTIEESRPTAVNLSTGVCLARKAWIGALRGKDPLAKACRAALKAAKAMHKEDAAFCRAMGEHGATLLKDGGTYLTHCNTGALATAGEGTAFSVFVAGKRAGVDFRVLVDETRPLLQGARLTALECAANGIPGDLIPDGAAGGLMAQGEVQGVFVGSDRIAANGDAANKVGTYPLAVLAYAHGIPFYVVAPTTTIDPHTPEGASIVIEQRDPDEVRNFGGRATAPEGFDVVNPAFDVTPYELITALITEHGVMKKPTARKISRLLKSAV
ncbi:MAG: S-methyl-5-thioribose-1-phosphate isomerase [Planctomycetota bacterium]